VKGAQTVADDDLTTIRNDPEMSFEEAQKGRSADPVRRKVPLI